MQTPPKLRVYLLTLTLVTLVTHLRSGYHLWVGRKNFLLFWYNLISELKPRSGPPVKVYRTCLTSTGDDPHGYPRVDSHVDYPFHVTFLRDLVFRSGGSRRTGCT